jgi:hypothetical protein
VSSTVSHCLCRDVLSMAGTSNMLTVACGTSTRQRRSAAQAAICKMRYCARTGLPRSYLWLQSTNKAELNMPAFARFIPRGISPQLGQRLNCDQARTSLTGKCRQSLNRPHYPAAQSDYTGQEVPLPDVRNSQVEYRAATKFASMRPGGRRLTAEGCGAVPCPTDHAAE